MPLPERNGPTLDDALRLYLNEKRFELDAYKGRDRQVRINEKVRVVRYLKECVGEEKRIGEIVRADVRAFRDRLAARGLAARSIRKNIEVAAAIVQTSISEYGIATPNPFHRFPVTTDAPASEARLPLTSGELTVAMTLDVNEELTGIMLLLAGTGARLNEIAGLVWDDVRLSDSPQSTPHLFIRTNTIRRLKTASSKRMVPLLGQPHEWVVRAAKASQRRTLCEAVFPRYGRSGGSDAASAALMKALRKAGITDKRKSIHSIRHSVKQALRDVGCPKDVRDAIQGHAHNSVAENYGTGHSLEVMTGWLTKALALLQI